MIMKQKPANGSPGGPITGFGPHASGTVVQPQMQSALRNPTHKRMTSALLPYLFVAPALFMLLLVYGGPTIATVVLSFSNWDGVSRHFDFVGVRNFTTMLSDMEARTSLRNTLVFSVVTVVVQNVVALLLALALNTRLRGRTFFRSVFFMPSTISLVAVALAWSIIFDPVNGPLPHVLQGLGLGALANVQWLADPNVVLYTICFVNIWQWTGWNMVFYLAGLQGIPKDLYEAARIDGASRLAIFRRITLPLLASTVTINLVFATIGGLKVFELPFIMTNGGPGFSSQTLTMTILNNFFTNNQAGYASALSLILIALTIIIVAVQRRALAGAEERAVA